MELRVLMKLVKRLRSKQREYDRERCYGLKQELWKLEGELVEEMRYLVERQLPCAFSYPGPDGPA